MDLRIGGARLWQNDAEGGLWDKPVPVNSLVLAPAERADVIADFRHSAWQTHYVTNTTPRAGQHPRRPR